jgi:hypothetical protein
MMAVCHKLVPLGAKPLDSHDLEVLGGLMIPCSHRPYVISFLTRGCVCPSWTGLPFIKCKYHTIGNSFLCTIYKFSFSRLWKAEHACFTYQLLGSVALTTRHPLFAKVGTTPASARCMFRSFWLYLVQSLCLVQLKYTQIHLIFYYFHFFTLLVGYFSWTVVDFCCKVQECSFCHNLCIQIPTVSINCHNTNRKLPGAVLHMSMHYISQLCRNHIWTQTNFYWNTIYLLP